MTLTAVGVDSSSKGRMNDKANITSVQALVKAIPKYTSCNGVDNLAEVRFVVKTILRFFLCSKYLINRNSFVLCITVLSGNHRQLLRLFH